MTAKKTETHVEIPLELARQSATLAEWARTLAIDGEYSAEMARERLARIVEVRKTIIDHYAESIAAAAAQHKRLIAMRDDLCAPIAAAEKIVRGKLADFIVAEKRKAEAAAQAERKRLEAEEAARRANEVAELEAAGDLVEAAELAAEPVISPAVIPRPAPSVTGFSVRMLPRHEIFDESIVPREFCSPDDKKIRAHQTAHGKSASIPGVRFYEVPSTAVRMQQ